MLGQFIKSAFVALGTFITYKLFFEEEEMAGVFISFDFENDRQYTYILKAMAQNSAFTSIKFRDKTPFEIKSNDIGRIKAALTNKIKEATQTVVIVGEHANKLHQDRHSIGEDNWQHWEIKKSLELGNKLVMVKIEDRYNSPTPAYGQNASWARSFTAESIAIALNG